VIALRALGALLTYPREELLANLPEIAAALDWCPAIPSAAQQRLRELIGALRRADSLELEETYVDLFDRTRSLSLHLFEHVHGDSRDRGAAMVDLKLTYERAGFQLKGGELPDFLPVLLEYLSCCPREEAFDMLGDCAHILRAIGQRLVGRGSGYAAVFEALLAVVAEQGLDWAAAPAPQETLRDPDEDWMEAPAFGVQAQPGAHSPAGATEFRSPGAGAHAGVVEVPLRHMPRRSR
jgi:nitrate reductase delta subunit